MLRQTSLAERRGHRSRTSIVTTLLHTDQEAQGRGFAGSPTFLIDEWHPFDRPSHSVRLACRLYPTPEGLGGVPPLADLRQALKSAAESLTATPQAAIRGCKCVPPLSFRRDLGRRWPWGSSVDARGVWPGN